MYRNFKVKALIFAGRKDTMSILFPLIKSDIVDEIIVGVNTRNQTDINFIYDYSKHNPKFKPTEIPNAYIGTLDAYCYMFSQMQDDNTIYIKLDDDLIFLSDGFFEYVAEFRLNNPEYICVYPFVVNNPLCNYLGGWFSKQFKTQSDCMYYTWKDPKYAYILLNAFADKKLPLNNIRLFEFDNSSVFKRSEIGFPICPSINAICFFGADCKAMKWSEKMKTYGGDEGYLTNGIFTEYGNSRKHIITPNALCCHYAFFTQRKILNDSGVLDKYVLVK